MYLVINMYEIIFTKQAAKFVQSLDEGYRNKIREIVDGLQINPFSWPYKKIKGETNLYRIRVGVYRILYEINRLEGKITILKIDHRSKVYE